MRLLIDTHVLIWWLEDSERLGERALIELEHPDAQICVSAASVWEISIKTALGRLKMRRPVEERIAELLEQGCHPLAITFRHAFAVRQLPHHHGDPFDRMLVAQALCEDLTLVTADPWVRAYDVRTLNASL